MSLKTRKIKELEELTITDDFMFGAVMSEPKNLKPLLEYILGIKISKITYPERQKEMKADYSSRGIRLDVYCEDDNNTIYNIEIQVVNNHNLPKRIRYYHDMIDVNILEKNKDFNKLKKSIVIFICTFDYYGKDRYMYTFKSQCQEDSSVYLGDDSESIVLYTNGSVGEINTELKSALKYMSGQAPAEGSYAEHLDDAVKEVKCNKKWRRDYMTLDMKIDEEKALSKVEEKVAVLRAGRRKNKDDFLKMVLYLSDEQFNEISALLDDHPEMEDWEIAQEYVFNGKTYNN